MSTLKVTNIQDASGGNSSTSAEIYSGRCKAWVSFNGYGTVSIRADFNVNTITDNGTGDYTVNFSNALTNSSYAVSAEGQTSSAANSYWSYASWVNSVASTNVQVNFAGNDQFGTHYQDTSTYKVIIFH